MVAATVTILFTDIVGHSDLYNSFGNTEAQRIVSGHFRLLRRAVQHHGGREVKTTGDGIMAVFPSATAAVGAAVEMQQAVARNRAADPPRGLWIRVGINTGEAVAHDDDVFGTSVIVAERICRTANADQIFVSDVVRAMVSPSDAFEFTERGTAALKNIREPVLIHQLRWTEQPAATGSGLTPFVGREKEMAFLQGQLSAARAGRGSLVFLQGEPGVGKTRLAHELIRVADDLGFQTLVGNASDQWGSSPYHPIQEALHDYVRDCDLAALKRQADAAGSTLFSTLPDLPRRLGATGDDSAAQSPGAQEARDEMAEFILAISRESPLMLVLDDLQWSDTSTLLVLQRLARILSSEAILVLGIHRDIDIDRSHPLALTLAELSRSRLYRTLRLDPLDAGDSASLVRAVLGRAPNRAVISILYKRTAGNPFYLEELAAHLREGSGELAGVPQGLRRVIDLRLARLGANAAAVLDSACVLGERFTFSEVSTMSETDKAKIADGLDEAMRAGLLREDAGCYSFSHRLVQDSIYESHTLPRRQALHLKAGHALQRLYGDAHAALLAYHFREAGPVAEPADLAHYSLLAAEASLVAHAYAEAASAYESVLDNVGLAACLSPQGKANAVFNLARARQDLGLWNEAAAGFNAAAELYRTANDFRGLADALLHQAGAHMLRLQSADALDALSSARDALEAASDVPDAERSAFQVRILHQVAQNYVTMRRYPLAQSTCDEALEVGRRSGDPYLRGLAYSARGICNSHWLRLDEAASDFDDYRKCTSDYGNVRDRAAANANGAAVLVGLGKLDQAWEWASEAKECCERLGNPYYLSWALMSLAHVSVLRAQPAVARRLVRQALDATKATGDSLLSNILTPLALLIQCLSGDPAGKDRREDTALTRLRPERSVSVLLDAIRGLDDEARNQASAIAVETRARRPDLRALMSEVALAETAVRLCDRDLAQRQLEVLQELDSGGVVFALGWPVLLPRLLGGLAITVGDLSAALSYLERARVASTQAGARLEECLTALELARLRRLRGETGDGPSREKLLLQAEGLARGVAYLKNACERERRLSA